MGLIYVNGEVGKFPRGARMTRVPKMLVDTGSEFTWIAEAILKRAGIAVAKKDLQFRMANGVLITRSTGYVFIRVGAFETVDEVVFAEAGDLTLLGAHTMEAFGATVDPRRKRLVAAGPHVAAGT
jgi:predicted aspartyl protease